MKIIILLSLATTVFGLSINPLKVEYHQFESSSMTKFKDGMAKVSGVKYDSYTEEYRENGRHFQVPELLYRRAHRLSQSVFRAYPGDTGGHGTAFYVGGNLILTNQHVLSPKRTNTKECKSFSIRLNDKQKGKTLKCEKVHYCSRSLDFCLIEMKDHKRGYSLKKETPLKLLKNNKYDEKMRTMVIGNPIGYGIHSSTGIGTVAQGPVSKFLNQFHFYAPLYGGNSGGPIIDDQDNVIGIASMQSVDLESEKAYNVGLPMETVLYVLEEKLKLSPEILNQLND
jgi:V8-like Glu-specific endopeptidase